MSHSDRTSKKNIDITGIEFLSDRAKQNQQTKNKNSKLRLSNEEVDSIRSSRKSKSSSDSQKKKSIFTEIVHYIVPDIILNKQTCQICEDFYLLTQLKEFGSCKHSFCEACLRVYASSRLNSFQLIICPYEGCNTFLQKNTYMYDKILTPQEITKHVKIQRQLQILKNPDLKSCKKQNCPGIINFKKQQNGQQIKKPQTSIKCSHCQLQYCPQCQQQKHEGKCQKLMVKFLEKNKKFRQCKKCKRVIQKSYGCTHMTCLCGYYFCYMCGQELKAGVHECSIPQDLNCLGKVRWDIEHREMFYQTNLVSFHRCFYFINFSSEKPAIVRVLFSLLYTLTIYPITIVASIFLALLFFVLLTIFLMLVFLFLPLSELCNNQDYCLTQVIAQTCGIYGLIMILFLFYPIFVIAIMIQAIRQFSKQEEACQQITTVFSEIGLGLRNVLVMPFILCMEQQPNQ